MMMEVVSQLCKLRSSVTDKNYRDDVLNLSDFIGNKIDPEVLFEHNFKTKGMEILFETAFNRFSGKSETGGVIKLTQAMGGGKTHNMLALALLVKHIDWRKKFLDDKCYINDSIDVVAFSGRESDAEFGIWGSIADQLGKIFI